MSGIADTQGTEYKNVRISVLQRDKQWKSRCIYAGTLSFTTKASSIKAENISVAVVPESFDRATVTVEVKDLPSDEPSQEIDGRYRQKEGNKIGWVGLGNRYVSGSSNTVTWTLYNLEETDYELKFNLGGAIKQQEFHFKPAVSADDVKAQVKVKNTFVNGLEIEAALTGVEANSEDLYTCDFQVAENSDSRWVTVSTKITLDATKPITKKIDYWNVHPGEKLRWRYVVYKNGLNCYIGYLDTTQTLTFILTFTMLAPQHSM